MRSATVPSVVELKVSADKCTLHVTFDSGEVFALSAELLRVESPSAEVRGHGLSEKKLVPGKQDVTITAMAPNGNYAVQIGFSDGHATGIYTWAFLYELGQQQEVLWQTYLSKLAAAGLSRAAASQ